MQTPQQPREWALSVSSGIGQQPKDFDWLAKNIPCQAACPAATDIPGYLEAVARGDFEAAYRINLVDNVFPAVLGRVCTRPCEPVCRHGWEGLGDPVAICFAKRSADDFMQRQEPVILEPLFGPSGKRVAVVGAGPAGLTVARSLVLWGHEVTLFDKKPYAGGNMVDAIPAFRLPQDIVAREVAQAVACGIRLELGVEIGRDRSLSELEEAFDAVVLAAGTLEAHCPELPGMLLEGVQHGVEFLNAVNLHPDEVEQMTGEQVVVIGGGFTAMDCARMAKRLQAESVAMYYRRSQVEMYIPEQELKEFMTEDIHYEVQVMPLSFNGRSRVESVTFVRTAMQQRDGADRAEPVALAGTEFTLPADRVLLGTGQFPTRGLPRDELPGRFVTGDFRSGAKTLIHAIGEAKHCALQVDHFLMGRKRFERVVQVDDVAGGSTGRSRDMDAIPTEPMPVLMQQDRGLSSEVESGLDEAAARREASRCYLCNYKFEIDNELCIYCDKCLKVMPVEKCIVRVSSLLFDEQDRINGYIESQSARDYNHLYLDQNECTRCGACVEVCPVDCITLQKVTLQQRPETQG